MQINQDRGRGRWMADTAQSSLIRVAAAVATGY